MVAGGSSGDKTRKGRVSIEGREGLAIDSGPGEGPLRRVWLLEAAQAVLYWRQSALKPNRNALWMEVNRLYRRILREQKKSAAAYVRQTGRLEGGSPMSAP